MSKVAKTTRVKTADNLYKLIKSKRSARTIENNVYKLSKGVPHVYYDYATKIMVMIIPKHGLR